MALLARYRDGDDDAATEIFERYLERLTALAHARLSKALRRKVDAEDVVQSAYRSFFRGAAAGKFDSQGDGKLWSLLAKITLRKVYRQAERHGTAKADMRREQSDRTLDGIPIDRVGKTPSPAEVTGIADEVQSVLAELSDRQRQMLELHLQGQPIQDVARTTQRSTKTVQRLLSTVEHDLEKRLMCVANDQ